MPIASFSRKCRSFVPAGTNHRRKKLSGDWSQVRRILCTSAPYGGRLHIFRVEIGSELDLTPY